MLMFSLTTVSSLLVMYLVVAVILMGAAMWLAERPSLLQLWAMVTGVGIILGVAMALLRSGVQVPYTVQVANAVVWGGYLG